MAYHWIITEKYEDFEVIQQHEYCTVVVFSLTRTCLLNVFPESSTPA